MLCTINKGHSFLSIVVFCSVYFVFLLFFLFFPLSLFILFSVVWGYKVSSIRTLFIFFVPFSYLSYFLRIFRLSFLFLISALFFSSLLSSVSNSPTLSRHGNPPVRSTPLSVKQNTISWVHHDGKPLQPGLQSPQPRNSHLASDWVESVSRGHVSAFPDPAVFVAGRLHCHLQEWKSIAASSSSPLSRIVLDWLQDKVQVQPFFRHFKGNFKGEHFDSASPPQRIFYNHKSCAPFAKFISDTILQRLSTGAISVWGKVGEVDPPHLVMPLTVESTKPRLCNDNRFLNLWMDDRPFSLNRLDQLPLYVSKDAYQTVCDDKSGYDHILLAPSSKAYFGFQWNGWYFISNTIPFGWKLSAYVYHSTGLLVSHYFRSIGIPCSLYIDDRHSSQIRLPRESSLVQSLDPERN